MKHHTEHSHTHVLEDGTVIEHTHLHKVYEDASQELAEDKVGETVHEVNQQDSEHDHSHAHTHSQDDGHTHSHEHMPEHTHSHGHGHGHVHTHENTKAVLNRLSRLIGHLQSIKRMVEDGRDCSEVLIQLSAVKAAINSTGKVILQEHIEHCLVDAIETGDMEAIAELSKAIDRFIK